MLDIIEFHGKLCQFAKFQMCLVLLFAWFFGLVLFKVPPLVSFLIAEFHDVSTSLFSQEEGFGGWKSKGVMTLGILN